MPPSSPELEAQLRAALDRGADRPAAARSLGPLLAAQGRWAEAEPVLRAALGSGVDPGLLNELGNALCGQGRLHEAAESYRQAILLRAGFAEAHYNLGNVLRDVGDLDGAGDAFARAASLRPALAEAHNNLGNIRFLQGRFAEAVPHYGRALSLRPAFVEARFNLGNALKAGGRLEEALAAYDNVGHVAPDHAGAWNNAGEVLEALGRANEAEACYARSVALAPTLPEAAFNLGQFHARRGRLAEGIALMTRATALRPGWALAEGTLAHTRLHACDWGGFAESVTSLRAALGRAMPGDAVPPFITATLPLSGAEQTAAARGWAARFAVAQAERLPPMVGRAGERIRLGYLSGDFHDHATATLTAELFEIHDREAFAVTAYSYGPDDASPMRERLLRAFDGFVDLRGLSDRQAAELIREDEVDVLVDLKGYTEGARTRILAHRPAPVQVNWLGFPGSMGADFIDYVIADAVVAPFCYQPDCVERIVHLPDCFQPNDRLRPRAAAPPAREALGLPADGFVFCCFNNSYKLAPPIFDIWMRLLGRVPGAVLWLLDANPLARDNLRAEAVARGIDPERLVFAPRVPLAGHVARLAAADLFLDTLPVNALTTASDALWAGLPVLTCLGSTVAGRGCASLLHAVACPDLVATSLGDYEARALALAGDPIALAGMRARLDSARETAPLFDTPRFTRGLEVAYRRMVERWRAGGRAEAFAV